MKIRDGEMLCEITSHVNLPNSHENLDRGHENVSNCHENIDF
jgi:hypothetical protein